jgi:hypothetical protein
MRRYLFIFLWLAVLVFVGQLVYFVFFGVRTPRYNEGRPLTAVAVSVPAQHISALYHDELGNVWIGTEGDGIYCFDIAKSETQPVIVPVELKQAKIRSLVMDKQRRIWVGTLREGLFIRCGDEWQRYEIGQRISAIKTNDSRVFVAAEKGLVVYDSQTDTWTDIDLQKDVKQVTALAFGAADKVFVGTACDGIFLLNSDNTGKYSISKHITAKRRFGHGSAPTVSPVPLDACGEGLPSNQINALLTGMDGAIWAATAAGLAWSRDSGENWYFVRGRDYGEKIRGLLAGTPHGWRELPRNRFGELFPEDDLAILQEDTGGVLWVGTRSLGCIAIKPEAFYRTILPQSDSPGSQQKFLEEMATNSTRFYGTKADQITAMASLPDGSILLASRKGLLEKMGHPDSMSHSKTILSAEKKEQVAQFPSPYPIKSVERESTSNERCAVLADDYVTGHHWAGHYGKTYTIVSDSKDSYDRVMALDESLCKIRLFVGFVGNRTRPLERKTLIREMPRHRHSDEPHGSMTSLDAWICGDNAVPKTADGQHLWCEVQLSQPGRFDLSLYFVDPDAVPKANIKTHEKPRDYLVEIFPEPPPSRTRIAKSDWQESGRRAGEWATQSESLAVSRVLDFGDGGYKRFALTGPGTYLVKVDKNYSRRIELCAVLIDRLDAGVSPIDIPDMAPDQTSDLMP